MRVRGVARFAALVALGCGGLQAPGGLPSASPVAGKGLDDELRRIAAMPPSDAVLHDFAIFVRDAGLAPDGCAAAIEHLTDSFPSHMTSMLPTQGCTSACGVEPTSVIEEGPSDEVAARFPGELERSRAVVLGACDARGPDPLFQGPFAAARSGVSPTLYSVVRTLAAPLVAQGRWSPELARTLALSTLRGQFSAFAPAGTYGRADLGPVADALGACPLGFGSTRVVVAETGRVLPNVDSGPAHWCIDRALRSVALPPGDAGALDVSDHSRPTEALTPFPGSIEVRVEGVVTGVLPMSTAVEGVRFVGDPAWSVIGHASDGFSDHLRGPGGEEIRPSLIVSQEASPTEIQLSHVLPGLWNFVGTADGVLVPGGTVVAEGRWEFAGDPAHELKWVGKSMSNLVVRDHGAGKVTVRWLR